MSISGRYVVRTIHGARYAIWDNWAEEFLDGQYLSKVAAERDIDHLVMLEQLNGKREEDA